MRNVNTLDEPNSKYAIQIIPSLLQGKGFLSGALLLALSLIIVYYNYLVVYSTMKKSSAFKFKLISFMYCNSIYK